MALAIILLLASVSKTSYAQSNEYVVFSIKGNFHDLHLGQILVEGQRVELPEKTEVKLISKLGKFVLLTGPISATITNDGENAQGEKALATISRKLFESMKFVDVLGGTRSLEGQSDIDAWLFNQRHQNPWLPAVSQDDDYCLQRDNLILGRPAREGNLKITINPNTRIEQEFIWKVTNTGLHVDQLVDPTQTSVLVKVQGRPQFITLHILQTDDGTIAEQAAWLSEHGCFRQALLLLGKSH